MKPIPFLFILLAFAFSCSSVKKTAPVSSAANPVGSWDFLIPGTPNGDYTGVISITKTDLGFAGTLSTSDGTTPFTRLAFANDTRKLEGEFPYSNYTVSLVSTVNGDELTGSVSTNGYEFPIKATRKK